MNKKCIFPYRGKRLDDGEWIEGLIWQRLRSENVYITYFSYNDNVEVRRPVRPDTITQYIGFNDKNGKYIFDGDIVKYRFKSNKSIQIGKVMYENAMYVVDNGFIKVPFNEIYKISVIGNIFDNPDLLEVKK